MEHDRQQTVYEFYDGDFYFYVVEHDDHREHGGIFRVRIDDEPEARACANVENHNQARPGWMWIRPACERQIELWFQRFQTMFPQRPTSHTAALRHLALHGPQSADELSDPKAVWELSWPICVVRNFHAMRVPFVERRDDGKWHLTETGQWLTTVIR